VWKQKKRNPRKNPKVEARKTTGKGGYTIPAQMC